MHYFRGTTLVDRSTDIGKDRVAADGPLRAMKVRVAGSPVLVLNGRQTPVTAGGGFLELQ